MVPVTVQIEKSGKEKSKKHSDKKQEKVEEKDEKKKEKKDFIMVIFIALQLLLAGSGDGKKKRSATAGSTKKSPRLALLWPTMTGATDRRWKRRLKEATTMSREKTAKRTSTWQIV